ncbi:PP2C family serine/threonine-protein phosphatase [Alkalibacillus salilacus]|uniref:Negative regulator of sigma-B (Phosphoserine phosphatase) n=1 Tax=Alkalibacillus salilacus TaxID=284582 RepID=A0ABT9VE90_9BACI|nr:PP2C family serine/threonine-protein phosphatase [Alkalibacillus salilacus]MDQ0159214.1 negative regulator of sigma-B (phosphoserine phosphatase) [Alkalibacillus salilacus]
MIEKRDRMEVATFQKPKKGNYHSGDSFFYYETEDGFFCALSDGLGSGEIAKKSADAVIEVIKHHYDEPLEQIIEKANTVLFGQELRGCVLGLLKIDYDENTFSYALVGNISVIMVNSDGKKQRNIPVPGYLSGVNAPVNVHTKSLEPGAIFFMFSDGVNEQQLTKEFYSQNSMDLTVEWFNLQQDEYMEDDTTLIAMKYLG